MCKKIDYRQSGVDIDAGNALVKRIAPFVKTTKISGVLGSIGGFSGAFKLPTGYKNPVLLSATDGVGTKLKIAIDTKKFDTVGIDLVAMCINDLICNFAKPLFFLDYYATAKLEINEASKVIKGIAKGCQIAQCALIGGETAEMPSMYKEGNFDLAGFCVGITEEAQIDRSSKVKKGDILLALPSYGLHSNGFSLVQKVLQKANMTFNSTFDQRPFYETLLTPTRIYAKEFLQFQDKISALAHITGGGIVENLPRVLPKGLSFKIDYNKIKPQKIFEFLRQYVEENEMRRTFNCGAGMIWVVSPQNVDAIVQNSDAYFIGEIV